MRVLILMGVATLGGVEQHCLTLAKHLRLLGIDAHLAGLVNAGGFSQLQEWTDPRCMVPIHWVSENAPDGLARLLAEVQPDLVNVQLPIAPEPLEAWGGPTVLTVHGRFSLLHPFPVKAPVVCLDMRWWDHTRSLAAGEKMYDVRNGIDLRRFRFRDDTATRQGEVAYWGRFDPIKMAPVRGCQEHIPIDLWGGDAYPEHPNLRVCGTARPEEVLYRYRVVTAAGLCALEAMACGALLLAPALDERRLRRYSDTSFTESETYPDGCEHLAWEDLQRLLSLTPAEVRQVAQQQRNWVERVHDAGDMARKFAEVYGEAT